MCEEEFGKMIEYGIYTEESSHRVHICPIVRRAYIFNTKEVLNNIRSGNYKGMETFGWTNVIDETTHEEDFCPIHGEKMTLYTKGGRSWYSHLYAPGLYIKRKKYWCNGKCEIKTAIGYRIEPQSLKSCKGINIPVEMSNKHKIKQFTSLSQKGAMAEYICQEMIEQGLIPIQINIKQVNKKKWQIKGLDLISEKPITIQVKCDYRGGNLDVGGTGYLYIQTHERNPFSIT